MKMEIELSDEQAKKVEILKENGIDVGQAIDILFDMKDSVAKSNKEIVDYKIEQANKEKEELEKKLAEVDKELSFFDKLKDTTLDSTQKQKLVEKEYVAKSHTYDQTIQDAKHKFKWSKSIFKF